MKYFISNIYLHLLTGEFQISLQTHEQLLQKTQPAKESLPKKHINT